MSGTAPVTKPASRSADHALLHTAVFFLALVLFFSGSRGGAPWARVIVLFVLFTVAATVWVRGQYVDSLDGAQWSMHWAFAIAVMVLGAVFFRLGLAAWILIYFGLGSLVSIWRDHLPPRWVTATLVCVGLVLGLFGLVALGRWPTLLAGVGIAGAALLVPLGASLVSEAALRSLVDGTGLTAAAPWRAVARLPLWLWVLAGASCFTGTALVAAYLAGSAWVILVMAAFALLVVALVSSTQADIVAVMAVLALMGVTPRDAAPLANQPTAGGKQVLVALGDSYMSGEGASVYYRGTDNGGGDQCRRSPTSWAAMAGQQRPYDGLDFLACSGARTFNVNSGAGDGLAPSPQAGEPGTQLGQYLSTNSATTSFTPALVTLSLGGNDVGFATIGEMCLAPGNCAEQNQSWLGALPQLHDLLSATYDQVRAAFPYTPVVVIPYPDPIDLDGNAGTCHQVALSLAERKFVHDFVVALNHTIKVVADAHNFYYLGGMQDALRDAHLQLCDPLNDARPGLNFVGLRSVNGIAEERFNPANWAHGSLHPNERGHAAMLQVFETWRADAGPLTVSGTYAGQAPATASANPTYDTSAGLSRRASGAPSSCRLYVTDGKGKTCEALGAAWAERQLSQMLLTVGLPFGGLVALGAWMASVGFFAWRRKVAGR